MWHSLSNDPNRPAYNYAQPERTGLTTHTALVKNLVSTPAFKRLKSIRFLGGIDYLLVPNPNGFKHRYTRYQHSIGVGRLALRYASQRRLTLKETDLLTAAALLHDIGHSPLSHSLEPVFVKYFGIDHHHATLDIITGKVPRLRSVYDALKQSAVDVDGVLAVLSGEDSQFESFFSGPINFDTIEGIMRSRSYAASPSLVTPEAILDAAIHRASPSDRDKVDSFWEYKDQVYRHVINSPLGILADFACQHAMEKEIDHFAPEDYFSTEKAAFTKMPELRKLLKARNFPTLISRIVDGPIHFKERRFIVDRSADFYGRADFSRYRQTKIYREFRVTEDTVLGAEHFSWKLFDEGL
jgi:HD superfamily phosphohydrolase